MALTEEKTVILQDCCKLLQCGEDLDTINSHGILIEMASQDVLDVKMVSSSQESCSSGMDCSSSQESNSSKMDFSSQDNLMSNSTANTPQDVTGTAEYHNVEKVSNNIESVVTNESNLKAVSPNFYDEDTLTQKSCLENITERSTEEFIKRKNYFKRKLSRDCPTEKSLCIREQAILSRENALRKWELGLLIREEALEEHAAVIKDQEDILRQLLDEIGPKSKRLKL